MPLREKGHMLLRWLLVAAAIAAAVLPLGCGNRDPYAVVRPKVGDSEVVHVKMLTPSRANAQDSVDAPPKEAESARSRAIIRCTRVDGDICTYEVSHRGSKLIRYSVRVDYSTTDLANRTVVRDAKGKVVPRGEQIEGVPVLFSDFLNLGGSYLPDGRTIWQDYNDSVSFRLRRQISRVHLIYRRYTGPDMNKDYEDVYSDFQGWGTKGWLWGTMRRSWRGGSLTAECEEWLRRN